MHSFDTFDRCDGSIDARDHDAQLSFVAGPHEHRRRGEVCDVDPVHQADTRRRAGRELLVVRG